jgi:hypothetical protein
MNSDLAPNRELSLSTFDTLVQINMRQAFEYTNRTTTTLSLASEAGATKRQSRFCAISDRNQRALYGEESCRNA